MKLNLKSMILVLADIIKWIIYMAPLFIPYTYFQYFDINMLNLNSGDRAVLDYINVQILSYI